MYKAMRKAAFHVLRPLPLTSRRTVDRWLRASHDLAKLARADAVVISFPKSGRTWVRAFLAAYFQNTLDLATDELLAFDNYKRRDPRAPAVLFTHDAYFDARLDTAALMARLRPRRPVLLVRDPRDTVVSAFYQTQFRMPAGNRLLYGHDRPALAALDDFVLDPDSGLRWVLRFYARWAERRDLLPDMPIIRYEALKADAPLEFGRLLRGIGIEPAPEAVEAAVEATRFERMKQKEQAGAFAGEGGRFGDGGTGRADAFKVRQGKVGGYRQSLAPATVEAMERLMAEHMPAGFGYRVEEEMRGR